MSYLFTSEAVSCGHPDKVADQISDAILDEALRQDPDSRVAIETMVTKGQVFIAGEMTTNAFVDIDKTVRNTIKEIGYDSSDYGFEYRSCGIITTINQQSPDIAMGVNKEKAEDQGAGDQGMMFGYATNESGENGGYMPLPLVISREIIHQLTEYRNRYLFSGLRPDAKSQVTVEYDDNGKPLRIDTILVSQQHDHDVSNKQLEELIVKKIINEYVIPKFGELVSFDDYKLLINPTGNFVIGGPAGDTGLTGRKIIVDTYGGACPHGGGAFSGKDPSKVDRSAAYMCRYVAKHLVAAGVADRLCIQVSYAIGKKDPVSFMVNTYGTGKNGVTDQEIAIKIPLLFDFTPYGITQLLNLKNPIYKDTARYGHFGEHLGNCKDYPWEQIDDGLIDKIKTAFDKSEGVNTQQGVD